MSHYSLIIGAGPAGFTAATWMAHLGIKARIVDKRSDRFRVGQADGVHARTQEIFASFGFGDRIVKEGNPIVETYFWVSNHLCFLNNG
jgi:phenol 2-monooxygenase (NADPH)